MGVTLIDNTVKIKAALRVQIAERLNNAGAFFVGEAQANAAVDTGFMRDHVLMPESEMATPQSLSTTVRSLAPYSIYQDTGRHGNLFFTRAYLATRAKFRQFLLGQITAGTVGGGIVKAAVEDYRHAHSGTTATRIRAIGGGFLRRGAGGRFTGVSGKR